MNSNRIFSRRIHGLDTRVWRIMFALIVVCVTLLAYRISDKDECIPFKIEVRRNSPTDTFYYTGESIRFVASVASDKMSWDFNDNSVSSIKGSFVTHTFTREAKYYVTASINPSCEEHTWVTVKNKPAEVNIDAPPPVREIIGPTATIAGKSEEFITPNLADSFYEWIVLNHPELGNQHGEKAKFRFVEGGNFVIQLTLDNDRTRFYTKRIYVEPAKKSKIPEDIGPLIPKTPPVVHKKEEVPIAPPPETKTEATTNTETVNKPKMISGDLFKSYLEQVISGLKQAKDFEKYGIFGNTPVVLNGSKTIKDFNWLCKELTKKKGLIFKKGAKVESAQLQRINEVITLIDVRCDW